MRTVATRILAAAVVALGALAVSTPASAGFDFLFSASHVSNDNQLFLNLTVSNYDYPRTVVEPLLPRIAYVEDDLPVILFLAYHTRRSPAFFVDLRADGLSWAVIFGRVRVPMDVLFVGIDRDPGPPYGNAWGHWRHRGRKAEFSDHDIRRLVRVQVGSRITGTSALELARGGGSGKSVATMVADRKVRPQKAGRPGKGGDGGHPHGRKGKGKGKAHGKGKR